MPATEQDILQYANDSGFPLQIAIQHAVEASARLTPWQVRYVEHGWVHPDGLGKGFIDLVLHGPGARQYLVVECKRRLEADWVFMHSSGTSDNRRHAKIWITDAIEAAVRRHAWADCHVDPPCQEANFCAVRGQGNRDGDGMLERVGAELVLATEALASAERDFRLPSVRYIRTFTPVVVTTARLSVANFDPAAVSLEDGKVPEAAITQVPWLRFRKQLATRFNPLSPIDMAGGSDPSYSMENTVFVVSASHFLEFLRGFELQVPDA